METWAKLFESAGRQVLVRKEANDDGDAAVKIEIPFSNGTACCVLGFETEAARDAVFVKMDQEAVDGFVAKMLENAKPFELEGEANG
jgi:hypothetical protein